ncbi:uncharacterized protein MELLADRAFT_110704 [Melampsora larici-populina 98AG31]|uniref:F-box domain-containing protein n=1 Tax=Melampsora larici-populina (strain 98AG31 / pathotype 3-4-7) TaxID=747676 RepID=F4S0P0_MELLP|nr:uncharacterized protein MELLADRAFT_110704 [Melampsora larici-populina 98AG31]EGG01832.1 hypothetical protein MELLADRAFT_110704 [Melampsora larici-populina 98AG31]
MSKRTTRPNLVDLPSGVIKTIFQLEPELVPLFLVGLGSKSLHITSRALVYENLTVDDDQLLLDPIASPLTSTPSSSKLMTILYGPPEYAECVKTLIMVPSALPSRLQAHQDRRKSQGMFEMDDALAEESTEPFGPDDDHSTSSSDSFPRTRTTSSHSPTRHFKQTSSHNDSYEIYDSSAETDRNLLNLLSRLANLRHFEWATDRLPMRDLCVDLGTHCPNLERFTLNLVNPKESGRSLHPTATLDSSILGPIPTVATHDHGPQLNLWTRRRSQTTSTLDDMDSDSGNGMIQTKPIRWDADSVDSLPSNLTHLHISSLSSLGSKNLSRAFEGMPWISLTELKLNNTLFVDDELMTSVAKGSKRIKVIKIENMSGTKLTERGIEVLFNSLDDLEEIEILDVEGRFSKNGWLNLDDLPLSLKSIKFGYHEIGSYHSWTLEHLNHLTSLLSLYPNKLERLSIQRFVPYPALIPGRHAMYSELCTGSRTSPKKMTKEQIMAIVEEGKSLKELDIDWWLISVEGLEVIVKGLPDLVKLRVLVDAPFQRIIGSAAFVHSKLRVLTVSIPPEHTPSVTQLVSPTNGSPVSNFKSSPTSPSVCTETSSVACSTVGSSLPIPTVQSPVPVRDIKKFIKRAGHLKEIIWTGRGGLGSWKFTRTCGSAVNVKVEFVPITESLPTEAFTYEPKPTHQSTRGSSISSASPISGRRNSSASSTFGSYGSSKNGIKRRTCSITHPNENGSRRSSEASLQSLSTSWGSSTLNLNKFGKNSIGFLEGIPGTPALCEIESTGNLNGIEVKKDVQALSVDELHHLDLAFA